MTTFLFYSFRFLKISPYINFFKFWGRILAPPSGQRPGADAPPCPPPPSLRHCVGGGGGRRGGGQWTPCPSELFQCGQFITPHQASTTIKAHNLVITVQIVNNCYNTFLWKYSQSHQQ